MTQDLMMKGWLDKKKSKSSVLGSDANRRWFVIDKVTPKGDLSGLEKKVEYTLSYYKNPVSSHRCGWLFLTDVRTILTDDVSRWITIELPNRTFQLRSPDHRQHDAWCHCLWTICSNSSEFRNRFSALRHNSSSLSVQPRAPTSPNPIEENDRSREGDGIRNQLEFLREINHDHVVDSNASSRQVAIPKVYEKRSTPCTDITKSNDVALIEGHAAHQKPALEEKKSSDEYVKDGQILSTNIDHGEICLERNIVSKAPWSNVEEFSENMNLLQIQDASSSWLDAYPESPFVTHRRSSQHRVCMGVEMNQEVPFDSFSQKIPPLSGNLTVSRLMSRNSKQENEFTPVEKDDGDNVSECSFLPDDDFVNEKWDSSSSEGDYEGHYYN